MSMAPTFLKPRSRAMNSGAVTHVNLKGLEEDDARERRIRDAIGKIADAPRSSYLEADSCCVALAAAELMAAARGRCAEPSPQAVQDWLSRNEDARFDTKDAKVAIDCCARIDADSELQQLFDEGGRNEEWHSTVADLIGRLKASGAE